LHVTVRVLFSTTAGAGHFGPMIPIARACAVAGHDVAVAAPKSFANHLHKAGFPHLPFPDVPAETMGAVFARLSTLPREEGNRVVVGEIFGRLDAQAAFPTVLETMKAWRPDIAVRDPCEFGALIAAARLGLRQVQVAIGVDAVMRTFAHWLDEPLRELEQIAKLDSIVGAERVRATPTFTSVPASLDGSSDDHVHDGDAPVWRYRVTTPTVDRVLPAAWGDPSAPLAYVSFGSVTGSQERFGDIYPAMLTVLADLPIRVLMTTGSGYDPSHLDPVPANAWVAQWWPQEAAMQEAALIIGHGGFGTTMTALAAGVPQLVMPLFSSDQFLNAERIQSVGAGLQLLGGFESIDHVPGAVHELLGQARFADAARTIAAEIAALPDAAGVVPILQDQAR
jgi:UDP:flavonoid glycosyltransferase YjiC (YdhE family)